MWQKGQSGNPLGRQGEKAVAEALRAAVNVIDPKTKRRKLQLLADVIVNEALKAEAWACNMIADRLDGKPAQESTVNVVQRGHVREFSDEELLELMVKFAPLIETTHDGSDSVQ